MKPEGKAEPWEPHVVFEAERALSSAGHPDSGTAGVPISWDESKVGVEWG